MADDSQNASETSDHVEAIAAKEDAETTAARRELKQTSISEKGGHIEDEEATSDDEGGGDNRSPERAQTPELEMRDVDGDKLREQISSPKKKRAHDQLDEPKDSDDSTAAEHGAAKLGNGRVTLSGADRSEPVKKRARDKHARESGKDVEDEASSSTTISARSSLEKPSLTENTKTETSKAQADEKPPPSASAFAQSGFAKLASSSASPFGFLGSSGKPSVFGSGSTASPSPFAAVGTAKSGTATAAPKFGFGGGLATGPASPFSGSNGQSTGFGGALGGTLGSGSFGSVLSGPRLATFAKPGEAFKSDKPAKPFGAPESDAEDGSGDDEDDEKGSAGEESSENEEEKEKDKDDAKPSSEDKKKPKLQKVVIDDGEAGEVTLLQVRAKMFQMEKGIGWKERGGGMLKVNVPESTIDFDDFGNPKPESFDASVLEDDDAEDEGKGRKNVRLIMRQDHTLRVILNTPILPAMDFNLSKKLKSSLILFTAFDGNEAKQVQMKMSEVNATAFTSLMQAIQRQLRDV